MDDSSNSSNAPPAEGFVPLEAVGGTGGGGKPRPHIAFKQKMAERLLQSGPQVQEAVVVALVDAQLQRRQKAILAAIEKLDSKDKELQKAMRAGVTSFGPDEKPLPPTFSKEQIEANRKLREDISKLEGALSKALDSNDYQKLFEMVGGDK